MTYNASPELISHRNRVTSTDSTIVSHEGINTSAYTVINSSLVSFTATSLAVDAAASYGGIICFSPHLIIYSY